MESESQVTLMLLQLMNRVNAEIRFRLYLIDEKRQSILYIFSKKESYNILRQKHINLCT